MNNTEQLQRIEKALRATHRHRAKDVPDAAWNRRVMAEVRRQPQPDPGECLAGIVQRLVWRSATAACSLALAMSFYALATESAQELLAMDLFMGEPLALQIVQLMASTPGLAL